MSRHWQEQTGGDKLRPETALVVEVCGFTFRFRSIAHLREALAFYEQKTHPTSRLPDPAWVHREARQDPEGYRKNIDAFIAAEHDVLQRGWERVPMHLQENGKRERVITAPQRALADFAPGDSRAATASAAVAADRAGVGVLLIRKVVGGSPGRGCPSRRGPLSSILHPRILTPARVPFVARRSRG
jgi:hypothetical protein